MKRIALIALLIAIGLLLVAALPGAASSAQGFAGRWVGEDTDGSRVRYALKEERGSEGRVFHVKFRDNRGSCCDDEPVKAHGAGVLVSTEELETSVVFWALGSSEAIFGPLTVNLIYDPDTDTVTDPTGVVFQRVDRDDDGHDD